jgi:hypothetical protein
MQPLPCGSGTLLQRTCNGRVDSVSSHETAAKPEHLRSRRGRDQRSSIKDIGRDHGGCALGFDANGHPAGFTGCPARRQGCCRWFFAGLDPRPETERSDAARGRRLPNNSSRARAAARRSGAGETAAPRRRERVDRRRVGLEGVVGERALSSRKANGSPSWPRMSSRVSSPIHDWAGFREREASSTWIWEKLLSQLLKSSVFAQNSLSLRSGESLRPPTRKCRRQRARSKFPACPICPSRQSYIGLVLGLYKSTHNTSYPQQNTPSGTREHLSAEETTGADRSAAANRPPAHVSDPSPWQPSPTRP